MTDDASLDKILAAMPSSAAGPSRKPQKEVTVADFEKVLDSTPLFMRETPADGEDNEVLEALRSLVFEGEGDEVAFNFKNHGNELYAQRSYKDAVQAYTQGLDAGPIDSSLRTSLLNNRAACNLALRNYGQVLRDTGVIIALSARERAEPPVKAVYRAAQSLVALERWEAARDCIVRGKGMKGEEGNNAWVVLGEEAAKGQRKVIETTERERRKRLGRLALDRAAVSRGLIVVNTDSPPDNPQPLHFDPTAVPAEPPLYPPTSSTEPTERWYPAPPHTPLVFPTFLLYPSHAQSDLITHFHQETSFDDQLAVMFPPTPSSSSATPHSSDDPPWAQWDQAHDFHTSNLVVYVETSQQRLLKVGKELTLREVLEKARREAKDGVEKDGVVLRDGLLSFVVLVKGKQETQWIDEFKRKRDRGKR